MAKRNQNQRLCPAVNRSGYYVSMKHAKQRKRIHQEQEVALSLDHCWDWQKRMQANTVSAWNSEPVFVPLGAESGIMWLLTWTWTG